MQVSRQPPRWVGGQTPRSRGRGLNTAGGAGRGSQRVGPVSLLIPLPVLRVAPHSTLETKRLQSDRPLHKQGTSQSQVQSQVTGSPAVQWLRPCFPVQGCGFGPRQGASIPHACGQRSPKTYNRSNVVTNSIKTGKNKQKSP